MFHLQPYIDLRVTVYFIKFINTCFSGKFKRVIQAMAN